MSKSDHSAPTKTCSICGLSKPLAAFLQYGSATEGAHYGNVCSSCRKIEAERAQKLKEDEGTTSKTSRTIDAKARVEAEAEKRKDIKQESEEYYEEREEKDIKKTERTEKTISLEKLEKKRRDSFLDRSFISKKETITKSETVQRVEEGAKQAVVREEAAKKADISKTDDIAKNIQVADTKITAGMDTSEKFKGGTMRAFMTQLGNSPIGRAFAQTQQTAQKIAQEKSATNTKTAVESKNATGKNTMFSKDEAANKETLANRIEKTWGPGKKR